MPSQKKRLMNQTLKLALQNELNELNESHELNEPPELNEPIECNHNICNPYVRTWYDEKFEPAGQAAVQLTQFIP